MKIREIWESKPSKKETDQQLSTLDRSRSPRPQNHHFWISTASKTRVHSMPPAAPPAAPAPAAATFHAAVRVLLACAQLFALLPVSGVLAKDHSSLRFTICSWRFLYTLVSFVGQLIMTAMCINYVIEEASDFKKGISVVFYVINTLTMVVFVRMARQWPALCRAVAELEAADPCLDRSLVRRCNLTVALVLTLALVEHLLSLIAAISVALDCQPEVPLFQAYITAASPWVFKYINFNNFIGVITQMVNIQLTFNWNFTDLFSICISYYLTSKLNQINSRISAVRGKHVPSWFWRSAREDYCRAARLVRRVDNAVSAVVFISFANNLFYICLQLFHTLDEGLAGNTPSCRDKSVNGLLSGYEHSVYFVYSFVYLMSRSLAVSLLVARVPTAARAPAPVLYEVPSAVYSVEVQRFIDQVHCDTVALSGLQFFNVTRGLVLTVAGTIVTYELVLVQFSGADRFEEVAHNLTTNIPTS